MMGPHHSYDLGNYSIMSKLTDHVEREFPILQSLNNPETYTHTYEIVEGSAKIDEVI